MTTAAQIAAAYPGAATVAPALVELGRQIDADPAWLANVIQWESRWNPAAYNRGSGASGLLQFMPATAKRLGTTTAEIRGMTAAEQMRFIAAYFRPFSGRLRSQLDTYMAVFYPAAVGKGPGYRFPARVEQQNPGIRVAADYARKANAVARLTGGDGPPSTWANVRTRLGLAFDSPADPGRAAVTPSSSVPSAALLGAAGLLLVALGLVVRRVRARAA